MTSLLAPWSLTSILISRWLPAPPAGHRQACAGPLALLAALNHGQASLIELHPRQGQASILSPTSPHHHPSPWMEQGQGTPLPGCCGVRVLPVGYLVWDRQSWQVGAPTGRHVCVCVHTWVPCLASCLLRVYGLHIHTHPYSLHTHAVAHMHAHTYASLPPRHSVVMLCYPPTPCLLPQSNVGC